METILNSVPIVQAYIEKKFDVIVALVTTAPPTVRELTPEIPIVFVCALYPIASGSPRKSVARSGGPYAHRRCQGDGC